jgi:hypothetical protein
MFCAANDMARGDSGSSGLRLKPSQSSTPRTPKVLPLVGIGSDGVSPKHGSAPGSVAAGSVKAHFSSMFALHKPAGSGSGNTVDKPEGNGLYTFSGSSSDNGERAVSVKVGASR